MTEPRNDGPRMDDARLAAALRAAVPRSAPGGSATRLASAMRETAQVRTLPLGLGVLGDVDPGARQRQVLLAAALLAAAMLTTLVALGALGVWPTRPPLDLSLEPPVDPQAYVVSVVQDSPVRRPMAFTVAWDRQFSSFGSPSGPGRSRVFMDAAGVVRVERFNSTSATEPDSVVIHTPERTVELAHEDGEPVWIEGEGTTEARVWIWIETAAYLGTADVGGCEATELDPTSNWEVVGVEEVLGRPAFHLRCGGDLWVDAETRLVLKSRGPLRSDGSADDNTRSIEVTALELGDQDAALFDTSAPAGVRVVTRDHHDAYEEAHAATAACAADPICSAPDVALVTPPPAAGPADPASIDEILAAARRATEPPPAASWTVARWRSRGGDAGTATVDFLDANHYRVDSGADPIAGTPAGSGLAIGELRYRTVPDQPGTWQASGAGRFEWWWDLKAAIPDCVAGWQWRGADAVGPFTADHLACGTDELWVDRESGWIVRWQRRDDPSEQGFVEVREITALTLGAPPADRLRLPDGATILPMPTVDPNAPHTPPPVPSGG